MEKAPRKEKYEGGNHDIQFSSQWQLILLKFKKHRLAVISVFVLAIIYLVAIFCEFLAPYDPNTIFSEYIYAPPQRIFIRDSQGDFRMPFVYGYKTSLDRETLSYVYEYDPEVIAPVKMFVKGQPYKMFGLIPMESHLIGVESEHRMFLLGTDRMGRDMLSRVIYGARVSTSIGLLGVLISFMVGLVLGGISGYYGGAADTIIQRAIEFVRSIPTIPLWLALSAALPLEWSSLKVYFAIVIILSLIGWTGLARVVRSRLISLKQEDFVLAARLVGASDARIIIRHLVPAFTSHIIASITLSIPTMIIAETSLSYLGIGLRPPTVSWGVLLQEAQNLRTVATAPWLLLPAVMIIVTVLAFNFLGDGLRDAADPYAEQGRL